MKRPTPFRNVLSAPPGRQGSITSTASLFIASASIRVREVRLPTSSSESRRTVTGRSSVEECAPRYLARASTSVSPPRMSTAPGPNSLPCSIRAGLRWLSAKPHTVSRWPRMRTGFRREPRASPTRKQVVPRFAILDDLSLRPTPAKLPGKPVGELIEGLLLIRRGVRVHEPSEPPNHLRLKRPKKKRPSQRLAKASRGPVAPAVAGRESLVSPGRSLFMKLKIPATLTCLKAFSISQLTFTDKPSVPSSARQRL